VPCRAKLSAVLRASLMAGKGARNVAVVPELELLRGGRGGSGGLLTYVGGVLGGTTARPHEVVLAAEAALAKAIEPAVKKCVNEVAALSGSRGQEVKRLRKRAEAAAALAVTETAATFGNGERLGFNSSVEFDWATSKLAASSRSAVRRVLHAPTLAVRAGKEVDEGKVVDCAVKAALAALEPP